MDQDKFTRLKYQTKDEWLTMRNNYLTGSDASCVIGLNPYKSNIDLWKEKVHGTKTPFTNNSLVEYGNKAEIPLRTLFKYSYPEYKVKHSNELLINKKYPFIAGSLDGELVEISTKRKGVWENKTAYISNAVAKEKWEDNKIPDKYYIQCLHYLLVTEYDFVILQVELRYEIDNKRWFVRKLYKFDKEEVQDDLDYLLKNELDFWRYVEIKKTPPLIIKDL